MTSPASDRPAPAPPPTARERAREGRQIDILFRRWRQNGDLGAREEIVRRHLPMARRLAGRYWTAFEPIDDLVQVACVGLLAAMERFDPERGVSFAVFAIPTILGELKRHFRDTGWSVHVPRHAQELARAVETASLELGTRTGRSPTVAELAEYLEMSTEDVLTGLQAAAAHSSLSLDAPAPSDVADSDLCLQDTLGSIDDRYGVVETSAALADAVPRLPGPERRALRLRLEHGLKQSEIAARLGCSQMQVSRLLRGAAARLRAMDVA